MKVVPLPTTSAEGYAIGYPKLQAFLLAMVGVGNSPPVTTGNSRVQHG
jgi:hypothetical protein